MLRIGADKADHIGRAGQILRTALLERGKEGRLDAQDLADTVDIETQFLAPFAQELADGTWSRHRGGNLVLAAFGKRRLDPLEYAHDGLSLLRHCKRSRRALSNRARTPHTATAWSRA